MSGEAPPLEQRLAQIAEAEELLVASDFDGTLAPLEEDPSLVAAEPGAIEALAALAALPRTHAAVVSGRALEDLRARTGEPERVHLVGSHGGEFGPTFAQKLPPEAAALRDELCEELSRIAGGGRGFMIERKPASVALHYRNADPGDAAEALECVWQGPAARPGVWPKQGKMVVELAVIPADKGKAMDLLRRRFKATAVVFVGDDLTDEDAFRRLGPGDLSIKVGPEPSVAAYRVGTTADVAALYNDLALLRARWAKRVGAPAGAGRGSDRGGA